MNTERDKFLTEAVYPDWFDGILASDKIPTCDFSSWPSFGKLKDFMCKLPDSESFFDSYIDKLTLRADEVTETFDRLQPDHFADAAYEYLQENEI